jgi:hypothetical protein
MKKKRNWHRASIATYGLSGYPTNGLAVVSEMYVHNDDYEMFQVEHCGNLTHSIAQNAIEWATAFLFRRHAAYSITKNAMEWATASK